MTPKEKAIELVDKMLYCYQGHIDAYTAKQCAMISVQEIIKLNITDRAFISEDKYNNTLVYSTYTEYWSEVLIEITKL
jgi:hypothetical protein